MVWKTARKPQVLDGVRCVFDWGVCLSQRVLTRRLPDLFC